MLITMVTDNKREHKQIKSKKNVDGNKGYVRIG